MHLLRSAEKSAVLFTASYICVNRRAYGIRFKDLPQGITRPETIILILLMLTGLGNLQVVDLPVSVTVISR